MTAPGDYLPTPPNPNLVLRDGQVALASSSIGSGLHEVTVQCVAAALRGVPIDEAADRPMFHGPGYLVGDSIVSGGEETSGIDALHADTMVSHVDELIAEEVAAGTAPENLMVRLLVRSGQVIEDRYPADVADAAESDMLRLVRLPAEHQAVPRGHWGAIQPDGDGGWLAARTPFAGGAVEAY
jgi:gamma-glutamyltranspeptidase/glutathione hydrolase